ncbi:hypothetical protein HBNXHr_1917 [Halorhabdus sp. BNX81]|nr:hypothetical protein HBNXHr_1917 [Halorhabdus sp. BNX81]
MARRRIGRQFDPRSARERRLAFKTIKHIRRGTKDEIFTVECDLPQLPGDVLQV